MVEIFVRFYFIFISSLFAYCLATLLANVLNLCDVM